MIISMKNILIVSGSVRPNNVNQKIVAITKNLVEKNHHQATLALLGELNMPFFDHELTPLNPDFKPTNESVKQWTSMVDTADAVLFVAPEYNQTISPLQLNAIDWIGREWQGKQVGLISYGWSSGGNGALDTADKTLSKLGASVSQVRTNLFFTKELAPNGDSLDQNRVEDLITSTINSL